MLFRSSKDTEITIMERPDDEFEAFVWSSFERTIDPRKVAEELDIPSSRVCEILNHDPDRYRDVLTLSRHEDQASWKRHHTRTHEIIGDFLELIAGQVQEIKSAAAEGRPTTILDKYGKPLPALDALQMVATGKLFGQIIRLGTQASRIMLESERVHHTTHPIEKDIERDKPLDASIAPGLHDFENMTDAELIKSFEELGLQPPNLADNPQPDNESPGVTPNKNPSCE